MIEPGVNVTLPPCPLRFSSNLAGKAESLHHRRAIELPAFGIYYVEYQALSAKIF